MITDKYTEQELREAWRIILNSPTISQYWKDYDRWFNNKTVFPDWDLLADRKLLSLIVMTLDEFQTREYKKGKTGACVTWGRELHNVLDLDSLKQKAEAYHQYVDYGSIVEKSIEKASELGRLSEEELELLQTAGVIGKGKTSEDSFPIPYLLLRAEFFLAYCDGMLWQIKKEQNSPEMKALREQQRQRHWERQGRFIFGNTKGQSISLTDEKGNLKSLEEIKKITGEIGKSVNTLVESMNTKTKEIPIEQKEDNKKTCITRLLVEGLITKSEIVNPEDKKYKYYATEKFTPENIRKCLCVNRIPWGHIASFKLIISESTKEPLTAEQLSDVAHNKARKKK